MRDADPAAMLLADLRAIFGDRLKSLVVYGEEAGPAPHPDSPLHAFAELATPPTLADLEACAARVDRWSTRAIAVPLLLAGDDFARSLDAFPLEYGAIIADHRVVFGRDPFERLSVRTEDVRRACEVEAKSHLLHLREGYIETGGHATDIAELIAASAPAFRTLVTNVARLHGTDARDTNALVEFTAALRVPAEIVRTVLSLRHARDLGPIDAERIFPAYLEAAERLAQFVDTWTS